MCFLRAPLFKMFKALALKIQFGPTVMCVGGGGGQKAILICVWPATNECTSGIKFFNSNKRLLVIRDSFINASE